jgi:hypothetical protein
MVTCSHYNVCNAPVQLAQFVTVYSWGHCSPFACTIIWEPSECQGDMCPLLHRVTRVQCSLASMMEPSMRRRPPMRSPAAMRDLRGMFLRRIADSFLRNEQRYNVGYGQNEGSSITRVMPPSPLTRISVASDLHLQHITDFDYDRGTFEFAHEGRCPHENLCGLRPASPIYCGFQL